MKTESDIRFGMDMLMPRYWGTWCTLVMLWVLMWLPRSWLMAIGGRLGDLMRIRSDKRRHIAEVNIGLCFPNWTEAQREQLLIEHFRSYGRGLIDLGLATMGSMKRLQQFCRVYGKEHVLENLGESGVIFFTFHTTTLEICSASILFDVPLVSMMKRDRNPVITWFLYRARTRFRNVQLYMRDESLRGLLKGVNGGRLCYLIPDEDLGEGRHTVYAPFFGQPRSFLNILSRLSRRTGAVVVPCICHLDASGHYITTAYPPLNGFPSNDEEDARTINQFMERLILKAPDQYMWTFRWFRTRPDGLSNPY